MKEKEFKLVLNEEEMKLLLSALSELPAKFSYNLITKVQQQAQESEKE